MARILAHPLAGSRWHFVNADGHVVGRLAVKVAEILRGKHKPHFNKSMDIGDHVVITNAEKVVFTGKKWDQKVFRWHTGWPGGLKEEKVQKTLDKFPEKILQRAIHGMLPKNKLRSAWMERLKIYAGPDHPHVQEEAFSIPQPHLSFDHSKWQPRVADPHQHRGFIMSFRDTVASLDMSFDKGPGRRRIRTETVKPPRLFAKQAKYRAEQERKQKKELAAQQRGSSASATAPSSSPAAAPAAPSQSKAPAAPAKKK